MTWLRRWAAPLLLPVLALAQVDLGDVLPGATSVRVAVIGDFGYGGSDGGFDKVAAAVKAAHAVTRFDVGLTVGDNFYPSGVATGDDTQWTRFWKPTYGALGIRFYPSLGNHDYMGDAGYHVTYSAKDSSWRMPAHYYTFAAGPVRFYALDTDEGKKRIRPKPWSDTQRDWLAAQLKAHAGVKWKIVYGHHPMYSDGHHGPEQRLQRKLRPLLKEHRVDMMLSGHEHDLQHHFVDGIHYLIAGGGGKEVRKVRAKTPNTKYAEGRHGFLEIVADSAKLEFRFRGTSGEVLHSGAKP